MKNKNHNGAFYGRQTPTKYEIKKEEARQKAIGWQLETSEKCLSYAELAEASEHFAKLAKRFGLIKEFKENGII